jgi:prepilin-type N-terminal cleavage/methylation domain-containing protein
MRAGFTLLEVLVTLMVASVATAAVADSVSTLIRARRATEILQAATLLAERSIEEMIAEGAADLATEDSLDRVTDPLGDFQRRRVVEAGPRDNLWHLVVTVTPPRGGPAIVFHTLLRRPWS